MPDVEAAPDTGVDAAFAALEAALRSAAVNTPGDFARISVHLHHASRMRGRYARGLGVADRGPRAAAEG